MRAVGFCIAEGIGIHDGAISLDRGWPEWWWLPEIPGETRIPVLVVIEHKPAVRNIPLRFTLEDEAGAVLKEVSVDFQVERKPVDFVAGAPSYSPFIVALEWRVERVGGYNVRLFSGLKEEPTARLVLGCVSRLPSESHC